MSPIKDFCLILDDERTFSQGDYITGTATFTLKKETKLKSVYVKAKGDASVRWSEGTGEDARTYSAGTRYFKIKEYFVGQHSKATVLGPGVHHFKFRFEIPHGDFPSTLHLPYGHIIYKIEANISRSWRVPSVVTREIPFSSKSLPQQCQVISCPQRGSVEKKFGGSKGTIQMSATLDRNVCSPGDTLCVVANIHNSSSKDTRPKFKLLKRILYRAVSSSKTSDLELCKIVWDPIATNSEKTVSSQVQVPYDVEPTFHNCEFISIDYYLKVYLDIALAFDPEVMFPLVVVPRSFAPPQLGEAAGPYPAGAMGPYPAGAMGPYPAGAMGPYPAGATGPYPAGAPSYSDFPPPAFPVAPYPVPAGYGAYGYLAPDPTALAQQHLVPSVPPQLQETEELPSYRSLFPPSS